MPAPRPSTAHAEPSAGRGLRHVMVVAGTLAEWADLDDGGWRRRIDELGGAAAAEGASWLTLRPYAAGDRHSSAAQRHEHTIELGNQSCTVIVEPVADGRQGFAAAMAGLDPAATVTETSITSVLYAPARVEPDLVIVLGAGDRLPPSLVWELAYAELVFTDVTWNALDGKTVHAAAAEFASRHRRFGGIES